MRHGKDEACSNEPAIDLISAVKELHGRSSQELNRLLRETENFTIHYIAGKGSSIKIDVEKLAGFLPLHLIAVVMSSDRDETMFKHLLSGIRLLHSLSDLAPRHSKLEQILLDDVKVSEQVLDLVFYLLIVLGGYRQEHHCSSALPLLRSALTAGSLYLLTGCISSQWQNIVQVLLAHPKVDIFMDVAFGAVHTVIRSLQSKLSASHTDHCTELNLAGEHVVNYLCQQGEASLQCLLAMCQQKVFRERLVKNKVFKELCGNGGVLFLAQSILKLSIPPKFIESPILVAAVSRLKAKILSILLHLFEAESVSYLDEVASSGSLDLAKSVAAEVLELLKTALSKNPNHLQTSDRTYSMGLLQLNALRLVDILSDDSNFRSYVTVHFTEVLSAIFSLSHGDFLSMWCSGNLPVKEEDATLEYDSFAATGWILDLFSSSDRANSSTLEFNLTPSNMSQSSYVHQRTSLFIKIIANLHCFVPNICEEQERNLFLHKFIGCLRMDPSEVLPSFSFTSSAQRASIVCRNLRSLLSHAESLIPTFLNEDDLQLLRIFFDQLQSLIDSAEGEGTQIQESKYEGSVSWEKFSKLNIGNHYQDAQSTGGCSSSVQRKEPPNQNNRNANLKEEISESSAFPEENQIGIRSNQMEVGNDVTKQERREYKDRCGASGVSRENDRDVQNVETSGSDTSCTRGKNSVDRIVNGEFPKLKEHFKEGGFGGVQEDEKVETVQDDKQRRKRKRTIMNDEQIMLMERALLDEPDMQRNTASIQAWADELSHHGSEVTSSQLRNWLNNRKARLARASKDVRPAPEIDNTFPSKQTARGRQSLSESPSSPGDDNLSLNPTNTKGINTRSSSRMAPHEMSEVMTQYGNNSAPEFVQCKPGQYFVLVDGQGEEIARGKVHQVQGKWYGRSLEESETCIVDILELKADRRLGLPYPSEDTGTNFEEAEMKIGVMRVMWDLNKIYVLQSQ
ncbi:nodulin homeobox isoform X1 [Carica papaya]|uniref:nodulin homeobox isoform X1 n=1 Tax=Carica papaya TaxID=3649 RepID=UPI000B8CCD93|nr:nodulin homeobox isoform X1 [Carica papaya]XP_021896884.1 nodulin homeobox isoform X1 [Carica papaya]